MQRLIELLNLGDPAAALATPATVFLAGAALFGLLAALFSLILLATGKRNALPPVVITLLVLVAAACAVLILPQTKELPPVARAAEKITPLLPTPALFAGEAGDAVEAQESETPTAEDFLIQDNE